PQTPAHPARANPRGRGWIVFALLAVAGAGGAAWYYHTHPTGAKARTATGSAENDHDGGQAEATGEAVAVATVHLSPGGITRTSTQIGSVHPYEEADLYAKVSGYLVKLHVNYGDRVKSKQVLAEIDDPEIAADAVKAAADVRQAEAAVAQAEAFVEAAKADRDASASAVEQSIAEVERYTSMRSYHTKKYTRYQNLVKDKAIPQQIADEEEEGLESARANELASRKAVLKVKADLIAAEARVKKARADLDEAKASVAVSQAKKARADAVLEYTKIVSPFDGVITKRNFFPGAFIRSAAEGGEIPLLTVARTDMVYVVTEIPDRDVPMTDVGDTAEITLDALEGEVFKGKVSRFAEAEDPTSRTMHTEIDLPNTKNLLRAGMYGIAKIYLDKSTKGATLPASCLVGESKGGKGDVFVDFHNAWVGDQPAREVINDPDWVRNVFEPGVAGRGQALHNIRGASPAASGARAIVDTIRSLTNPTPHERWFSAAVAAPGVYGVPGDLVFGFPVRTEDGLTWSVVPSLYLDDHAQERIAFNVSELEHDAAVVADFMPSRAH
ncbi:MAG: efflux RND transporter periplasmic adaptor subunit, partial [Planctomycetia bacterium]|nr:efflux RND transporter periplasmic adaptor subunit [Planctomycetia bacterium]